VERNKHVSIREGKLDVRVGLEQTPSLSAWKCTSKLTHTHR